MSRRIKKPKPWYWAYGSNLNVEAMQQRCRGAKQIGPLTVTDGALVFRGVADVQFRTGTDVPGGLWLINDEHEEALDRYEGVRHGLYLKRYLKLLVNKEPVRCIYYTMRINTGVLPPSEGYLDTIVQGYRDFELPLEALDKAVRESWNEKEVTPFLSERRKRRGEERLARLPMWNEVN